MYSHFLPFPAMYSHVQSFSAIFSHIQPFPVMRFISINFQASLAIFNPSSHFQPIQPFPAISSHFQQFHKLSAIPAISINCQPFPPISSHLHPFRSKKQELLTVSNKLGELTEDRERVEEGGTAGEGSENGETNAVDRSEKEKKT